MALAASVSSSTTNQINIVGAAPTNTQDKYEQLFKVYDDFQKDGNIASNLKFPSYFWSYLKKNMDVDAAGFTTKGIEATYEQLKDKNNLENVKQTLKEAKDKQDQETAMKLAQNTEKSKKIEGEKSDRLKGLLELRSAITEFNKDPRYTTNNSQIAFLGYLKERKAKANDTSLSYYGFDANEIELKNGKIEKPSIESIRNEEKIEETPKETTLTISRKRLGESIGRYIDKVKALKNAKEGEKKTLEDEIKQLKEELKKEKDTYEKVKQDFFAKSAYTFQGFTKEDLGKIPTNMIRYATREGKLFNAPGLTKMKTLRRNKTIKTLIKKFNAIGTESKNGVRFIMGFEKARFLRYTGIKVHSAIDKAGSAMGMQMNPQDFHTKFNAGRNAIFAILDANTGDEVKEGSNEDTIIKAIKNRINYYGATYARDRANAWVAPFIDTEKNAPKEGKIIQMPTNMPLDAVA